MVANESTVTRPRLIVALDYPDPAPALALAGRLEPGRCRLKVGKELFTRSGPALVERLGAAGFEVFLDLKYHDIPNTVAGACRVAADLGVWMLNVHALGGRRMMEAAREAVDKSSGSPLLIAVTLLTSLSDADIHEVGLRGSVRDNVLGLAALARASGMDGLVCSPQEAGALRTQWPQSCLVTPGVRPAGVAAGDQVRTMTPAQALRSGASYLVVGRAITAAAEPMQALRAIEDEIAAVIVP